ncbi:MAG TPA: hypothetical protein VFE15_02290 [Marmoricola sp.]|nr:hypothetical protein [Marmoricola sp.]
MKSRHFLPLATLVAALATALGLGALAPANADPDAAVTNLVVTQAQGPDHTWKITATWDANPDPGVTGYHVVIADQASGIPSSGGFGNQDTSSTTATITTSALADNLQYWVAVTTKTSGGTSTSPAVTAFTAITLDRSGPTGAYTENRRVGYRTIPDGVDPFSGDGVAQFTLHQTGLSDNVTASAQITRTVTPGDGDPATVWATGDYIVTYKHTGTYTPIVNLTDQAGNTTHVSLPTLTVKNDVTPPTVRITKPAKPSKVASWRQIRGTAIDGQTGIEEVLSMVIEKRHGTWYAYDFRHKKWLKGFSTIKKTLDKTKAEPADMHVNAAGVWHTPTIKHLTAGSLHIEAFGIDNGFNFASAPNVNAKVH